YLSIAPDTIGHINFGLDILGLAEKNDVISKIFHYMYPNLAWGNQPSSSHIMAYSLGGIPYLLLTLILTGIILSIIASIKNYANNAICFSIYLSGLMMLYYLTQTSFEDSLISSYGIVWSFFAIIVLIFVSKFIKYFSVYSQRFYK